MKTIILVSLFALSFSAFAQAPKIKISPEKIISKQCDGNAVAVNSGEGIYIDPEHGLFGLAFKDDKECTNVDLVNVMMKSSLSTLVDGKENFTAELLNFSVFGRKSTCASGISSSQGIKFDMAQIVKSEDVYTVTLTNADQCKNLVLSVQR